MRHCPSPEADRRSRRPSRGVERLAHGRIKRALVRCDLQILGTVKLLHGRLAPAARRLLLVSGRMARSHRDRAISVSYSPCDADGDDDESGRGFRGTKRSRWVSWQHMSSLGNVFPRPMFEATPEEIDPLKTVISAVNGQEVSTGHTTSDPCMMDSSKSQLAAPLVLLQWRNGNGRTIKVGYSRASVRTCVLRKWIVPACPRLVPLPCSWRCLEWLNDSRSSGDQCEQIYGDRCINELTIDCGGIVESKNRHLLAKAKTWRSSRRTDKRYDVSLGLKFAEKACVCFSSNFRTAG
ncbi:unnamed protein product [Notodromas monacha]|uniref:Uncharacterized protein n=1 Tax=Notodromas monacha TaxID=399045 RepID=A0A7R9BFY7_9CRUS|nr:unnamed protein product [Notodromas monacha]CAG0914743.1 unnamed protein product [Notodromas monacha]